MNLLLKLISSPWFWADVFLSVSGGLLVAWGLWLEKRAEKHIPPTDFHSDIFGDVVKLQKIKEQRGWCILMVGIIVEVVAALGISVISGLEIADLSDQTAAANLESKQAENEAGQANERAAATESNNLVLRLKLQPRTITMEQVTNFIFLTHYIPKIKIRVAMGPPNSETFSYAVQIRDMLNQGGFGVPNSDTNLPENIHTDPTALVAIWEFGNVHEWPDLSFNTDQTNDFRLINFPLAMGNGFSFPYFSNTAGDTNEILSAIYFVFEKIGFRCTYACKPDWTSPNHYEIYVEEKPQ